MDFSGIFKTAKDKGISVDMSVGNSNFIGG